MQSSLTRIVFFTFVYSLLVTLIATAVLMLMMDRSRSEMPGLVYGVSAFSVLVLAISSCAVYLNLIVWIRQSLFSSALTFFALPLLTSWLWFSALALYEEWELCLIIAIPFFVILGYQFTKFRQRYAKQA